VARRSREMGVDLAVITVGVINIALSGVDGDT
jgi:hypothetical protein